MNTLHAKLFVLEGSGDAYKFASGWMDFMNIYEIEDADIKDLKISNVDLPVYDLNGMAVDENALKSGVYIKNRKKVIIK